MTYLLDTHVLLWLLGEPARLPDDIAATLADRRNALLVSAGSAWEVSTKVRLGRLESARALVDAWSLRLADIDARELPVTSAHALLAGSMTWEHRDPFDRLLAAQAMIENVRLVTTDSALARLPWLPVLTW